MMELIERNQVMLIKDENGAPDMLCRAISQYQLIELLGKGSTSFVYKAFQPSMNRYVAVKLLFPWLAASTEFMEQFQRRLAIMASLQQNHILPLYDFGQEGEIFYLAIPYVSAGTLEDYLPDYYSPQAALRIIRPLAGALDYGHDHGLVHANLNPEKILIDEEQRPMLADFGGLRKEPVIAPISNAYTSPEQVRGLPVDRRSDVYGLGALLYTLLINESPAADRVPTPRAYRPDLAPALEKVILKAMASAPEQRFQSAAEFRHALERAQGSPGPVTSRVRSAPIATQAKVVPGLVSDRSPDSRSLTRMIIILGIIALLAAVVGVYSIFFGRGDGPAVVPTAPPGVAMVTTNRDVKVRSGPDTAYEVVGVMRQGQNAEAIGVSPDYGWWVIGFPAATAGSGWLSSQFVSATDTDNLPIIQPPPLPGSEAPVEATEPLSSSLTSDEIAETVTVPAVKTSPAESQPTEGNAGGTGVCYAPAPLLVVGLILVAPLGRRH
jgi:serine/threonine protein kinase